jgi:threonine aldolase
MATVLDLRSDTVTKPTPAMREAMARAEVGDDVYGEDPTVNALQEKVAALLGKEAALYMPSGSMTNQVALKTHTQPGDDVLISQDAHIWLYEGGAGGGIAGVQFTQVGSAGLFTEQDLEAAFKPDNHHQAPSRLVCVENTHNRAGGRVWPQGQVEQVVAWARAHGCATHLDGARLWNAHVACGKSLALLAAPFDSVSVCLSKGLGAPVGSLLAGSKAFVHRAHRWRKMYGGGMRQAGILAAAGIYALDHHVARLADDHAHAQLIAAAVRAAAGVRLDTAVETNLVIFETPIAAQTIVERARERGVLVSAVAARKIRAVTHLDIDRAAAERAAATLREVLAAA